MNQLPHQSSESTGSPSNEGRGGLRRRLPFRRQSRIDSAPIVPVLLPESGNELSNSPESELEKPLFLPDLINDRPHVKRIPIDSPDRLLLKDNNDNARRVDRLLSDGSVYIHQLMRELPLADRLTDSLRGEGVINSGFTSGLGLASKEIGGAVVGTRTAESLFSSEVDSGVPSREVFEDILARKVGGRTGEMLTTLLMDVSHPYVSREGDGYIELPATEARKAYLVKHHGAVDDIEARFCSDTEYHFSKTGNFTYVEYGGEKVGMQKHDGNHTALLLKPAIINGVRIPVGSVMTINQGESGLTFAFGRLTPFCYEDPIEGMRQFSEVFNENFGTDRNYMAGGIPFSYEGAHRSFCKKAGVEVPEVYSLRDTYVREHPELSIGDCELAVMQEIDKQLEKDPAAQEVITMIHSENRDALVAAKAAATDKKSRDDNDNHSDPRGRDELMQKAVQSRIACYEKYGVETVKHIERLINVRDSLAAEIRLTVDDELEKRKRMGSPAVRQTTTVTAPQGRSDFLQRSASAGLESRRNRLGF